jgi:type IV secretory pathway VirJ component
VSDRVLPRRDREARPGRRRFAQHRRAVYAIDTNVWRATLASRITVGLLAVTLAAAPPAPHAKPSSSLAPAIARLDLPITVVEAKNPVAYLVFISGDGGWASLDSALADALTAHQVTTLGWSSLKYFFRRKKPRQVAADLRRVLAVLEPLGRPVYVGGYSFGAEIVPLALAEMTPAERRRIGGLLLLAPSESASFQIDPRDWIREPAPDPAHRVDAAIRRLGGMHVLCLSPVADKPCACPALGLLPGVEVVTMPGDHHFEGDAKGLAVVTMEHLVRPGP